MKPSTIVQPDALFDPRGRQRVAAMVVWGKRGAYPTPDREPAGESFGAHGAEADKSGGYEEGSMNDKKQAFDLEAVYDADIAPLMTKIIEICKAHKLPMFAAFLYQNDPEGENGVCSTNLMFADERPVPEILLKLLPLLWEAGRRRALRMRVTKADGSIEETVIL